MSIAPYIAWRYLVCRKSSNSVGIITVVSMLGVAVATAAIVCVLSVFNGFSQLAMERMSMIDAPLRVVPVSGKTISMADSLAKRLSGLDEIDRAAATISENALGMFVGRQMAVTMIGVPEDYRGLTRVEETIIDGDYTVMSSGDRHGAIVSVGTAMQFGVRPGSQYPLKLYVPRRLGRISAAIAANSFFVDSVTVEGVYRIDDSDRDANSVVVPISMARRLLQMDDEASAIELVPAEGVSEDKAAAAVSRVIGRDYRVLTILEQEEQSFKMISVEKWITFVMLAFILIIASFNIISTLSILIIEKDDNIRTMRYLGATQSQLRRVFGFEGWLVSAIGGGVGMLTGVALCLAQQTCGFIKISGDETQLAVTTYPVRVEAMDMVLTGVLILAVGMIIGWVASRFVPRQ